jgi:hypothetical protein
VLDSRLQSGIAGPPKWEPQLQLRTYIGHSPLHTGSVALVFNPCTGHISPQFYVVFNDLFSTVSYMEKSEVPPNWADLVENSQEKVIEEEYNLAKMRLFPEVEVGDITMQDTPNNFTQTPARESSCTLVPPVISFDMQPLSNSSTFESTDTMQIPQNDDFIPHPSLKSVTTLAPSSLVDDLLLAPCLINLETLGLRQSARIAALNNATSDNPAIAAYSVFTKQLPFYKYETKATAFFSLHLQFGWFFLDIHHVRPSFRK